VQCTGTHLGQNTQKSMKILSAVYDRNMRDIFSVGELAGVDSGYASGIWLRDKHDEMRIMSSGQILPCDVVIVLEIDRDSVHVIGRNGVDGWTWKDRLRKLT